MLVEISPILESFVCTFLLLSFSDHSFKGNAKTAQNDNSSRFGKFIEVYFGTERQGLVGAKIVTYI
jgi:myosin heavy subunit